MQIVPLLHASQIIYCPGNFLIKLKLNTELYNIHKNHNHLFFITIEHHYLHIKYPVAGSYLNTQVSASRF